MRAAGLAVALTLAIAGGWARARPAIGVHELTLPAFDRAAAPACSLGPDGRVWLSWIEPAAGKTGASNALRCATFDPATKRWREPRTIVANSSVVVSPDDVPQLAIDGRGKIYAVWTNDGGGAWMSASSDQGATWTAPKAWTTAGNEVEKFSFARLSDGRVLSAWLDGRSGPSGAKRPQRLARVIDAAASSEQCVDPAVGDCGQTTIAPFLDGSALLAYRGRTNDDVRDIQVARWREHRGIEPRVLVPDEWRINSCPVNGPRLATDGSRVAAAWFTGAGNDPRVQVSYSPDAGARWLMPLRVDRGHPVGQVDTIILHDGAILVAWVEADGSVWLRRITPEFTATDPIALAPPGTAATSAWPRLALLRDYAGDRTTAKVIAVLTRATAPASIRTVLVTIPEGDLLSAERNCDCSPTAEELQGFAIHGVIVEADPATNTLRVRHDEVPGVFAAGTDAFQVAPLVLPVVRPGHEFLGRIDRQAGAWWLGNVRVLGAPR